MSKPKKPRVAKTKDGREVYVNETYKVPGGWEGWVVNAKGYAVQVFIPEKSADDE
jgi:hypothetical protein